MSIGHLYVLFGEVSVQVFCPFFNWVVYLPGVELYEFFMYFGDYPLFDVSLANMFSHRVGSCFILMMVSLAVQKVFRLIWSHFFIVFLYFPCPGKYIRNNIAV